MAELRLLRGSYARHPMRFAPAEATADERLNLLAACVAKEVERTLGDLPADAIGNHYLSTTIIDHGLSWRSGAGAALLSSVAARTRHAPGAILNAYECAGWGYALRHALHTGDGRAVACTVVDLNVFDFAFWRESTHWGHSGFGVAVLLIEPSPDATVTTGYAKTGNMLAEFAMAVRGAAGEPREVALPFFPRPVSSMFDRAIPNIDRLPDQHAALGHCFGSDPWILILQRALQEPDATVRARACSVALNGYWSLADVRVDPGARLRLELAA